MYFTATCKLYKGGEFENIKQKIEYDSDTIKIFVSRKWLRRHARRMNTVLKCHWAWSSKLSCKLSRRYDQSFSSKWRLKLLFLVIFRIFPNWNCHFRSGLCDVVSMYGLQSYRFCTFCKRKTRGETQFWIELAAPCTLANHNEINSDRLLNARLLRLLESALASTLVAIAILPMTS